MKVDNKTESDIENKAINQITLKYKPQNEIRLFGIDFIKNNEKNCSIIYNNKKYNLQITLPDIKTNDEFEIKLP